MFTTVVTWLTLIAAVALAVMALGAQSARTLRRLRDAALALMAASAGVGVIIWGTPEQSMLAQSRDLSMMALAAAVISIIVMFLVTGRQRQYFGLLGVSSQAREQLLQSVVDTVGQETTLNRMLLGVASSLRNATGAKAALVYKLQTSGGTPLFVGSAVSKGVDELSSPFTASLAARYALAGCVSEFRPDEGTKQTGDNVVWGIIPLAAGNKILTTILLKEPAISITTPPVNDTILTVAALTGRALSDWVGAVSGEMSGRLAQSLNRLAVSLLDEKSLEHGLPAIAKALKGIVPADYLSISWFNRAHFHEDRASMIIGQHRVVENRRRWPIWDGPTHRLLGMARPLITPDLLQSTEDAPSEGSWETRLGLRSRIVVPIRDGERLLGSLTLAHRKVAHYGHEETGPLVAMASCLGLWLKQLEAIRTGRRFSEVTALANQWDHHAPKSKTDQEILKEAHRAIKTSALRLYRLTVDGEAMEIVAHTGRANEIPAESTRIPLTKTPWHRCSLEHGTPHYIDQSDPESLMGRSEVELSMLPRMKTGWIVPITCGGSIVGFVDAIETRDPDRQPLDEPERLLLGSLARVYSRRWSGERRAEPRIAPIRLDDEAVSEFNHEIINPLTGIIGSVELIRHKQPALSDDTIKYLNVIERSANRIHTSALKSMPKEQPSKVKQEEDGVGELSAPSLDGVVLDTTANRLRGSLDSLRNWRMERLSGKLKQTTGEEANTAK